MPIAAHPLPPVIERFVPEALAGAGGMGTVYRARDTRTGQMVALKLLRASDNPKDVERFAREAQLLSELRHPGIVEYLAHGVTEAGEPYLAMEWLSGEDLSQRLSRGGLSLADSLTLLQRTAEALAVAHARGVVHRDLKPSNLFLRDNKVERVALLDFGIARRRALTRVITGTGVLMGTPSYMAPEQARGQRALTPAVDVFSLGCVLFECLTGEPPFVADQAMAVLARIVFDEAPKLRFVRPDLPRGIEILLERMLEKDPAARLPDAAAVLVALASLDAPVDPTAPTLSTPAPAPRSDRADTEQHLVSVLIAIPEGRIGAEGTLTMEGEVNPGQRIVAIGSAREEMSTPRERPGSEGLLQALKTYGARAELLANGSLVATLIEASGTATDQAAQAARCALLIKARWPDAAIALCTGRGLIRERLPIGDVLDRATRLLREHAGQPWGSADPSAALFDTQGAPRSEQILLDEVTRGLLGVRFHVARTPSGAHALTGEELTLDTSRPLLGKPTPCVGREAELGMLELVLSGCIEDAAPRAVLVTAPPGAGKSRLRHEFLRRVGARGGVIQILIGRGDPMSTSSAYGLLGQALRRLCGILDGESLEARRAKLAQRVGEHLPAAEQERVVAFAGELCGVPFPAEGDIKLRAARQDPLIMSDQITTAMLDFLRAECAERPTLLVLEDLHWGDALTMKLVETALRELGERPLMVLALARPEVQELLPPSWAAIAQPLLLRPLSKKAGERLVHEVLGARIPKETIARIVEQSAGNALFLEELIRSETEGRGAEAPETVLAILQARIGRLQAGARWVLRSASVFGELSWMGGIRALLGAAQTGQDLEDWLRVLLQEEILEERRESRFPGERELRFRHGLMRDAAYGLLTADDCVEGHRGVAHYLSAMGEPDALVLAEHFEKGREEARAVPYYLQAAEQSYETNDMNAALACAERGLGCGAQGEPRGALLSLEVAAYLGRERYAEVIALGIEALGLLPEGSQRWCRVFHGLFPAATMTQQIALLGELSSRFARVEPSAGARDEYVRAITWLAVVLSLTGMKDAARAFLERARQVVAVRDPGDLRAWGFRMGAESNNHHVIEEAPWSCMVCNAEGQDALHAVGDKRTGSILRAHYGKALMDLGDRAGAEVALRENLGMAERLNEALPLTYAKTYLAHLLADGAPLDQLDEPAALARAVIAAKNASLVGWAYRVLGQIKLRQGDLAGAQVDARAACEAARPFPAIAWEPIAFRVRVLLAQGCAEEALGIGEDAVREMERLGLAGYGEIALRLAVAEAHHAVGHKGAARGAIAETVRRLWFRVQDIPEAAARERYLTEVLTNARLIALARAWLGDEAVTPPVFTARDSRPVRLGDPG